MTSAEVFAQFNDIVGGKLRRPTPNTNLATESTGISTIVEDSNGAVVSNAAQVSPSGANVPAASTTGGQPPDPPPAHAPSEADDGSEDGESQEGRDAAEDEETTQKSWIAAVKRVVQFKDLRNNERVVPIEDFTRRRQRRVKKEQEVEGQFKEYAMVLRKILSVDLRMKEYRLEIQSQGLRRILRDIARPFHEVDLDANPIIIRFPFRCLFFLRDELKALQSNTEIEESTREEVKQLLRFTNAEPALKDVIEDYEETVEKGKVRDDIIWTLFRPHDMVYYSIPYAPNSRHIKEGCGIVEKIDILDDGTGKTTTIVSFLIGHHSGSRFGLTRNKYSISSAGAEIKEINSTNLPVIPLRFLSQREKDDIYQRMVERGKKYIQLCKAEFTMLHYRGPVAVTSEESQRMLPEFGRVAEGFNWSWETNQRVVVDKTVQHELSTVGEKGDEQMISLSVKHFLHRVDDEKEKDEKESQDGYEDLGALLRKTRSSFSLSSTSTSDDKGIPETELTDDDYATCSPDIVAFLLRNKLWVGILVAGLEDVRWRADPYSHLQMSSDKKSLIRSLVVGFSAEAARRSEGGNDGNESSDEEFDDFIEGKGRGLIFLLHGEPGLGKTLTAESVAESTRRPLYHVSTGELSTEVKALEDELTKIFRLGLRWRSVVLLDEADVLMSRRNTNELQRNAIVAVFLRMLEYYEGMLFLTTNRLTDFDEAFYNRIHVTVKYPPLGPAERTNIWRQHLLRACKRNKSTLAKDSAAAESTAEGGASSTAEGKKPETAIVARPLWCEEAYALLGEIGTNGRDIRNYTRTAFGFAQSMDKDMDITHVVAVIRNNLGDESEDSAEKRTTQGRKLEEVFGELEQIHKRLTGGEE